MEGSTFLKLQFALLLVAAISGQLGERVEQVEYEVPLVARYLEVAGLAGLFPVEATYQSRCRNETSSSTWWPMYRVALETRSGATFRCKVYSADIYAPWIFLACVVLSACVTALWIATADKEVLMTRYVSLCLRLSGRGCTNPLGVRERFVSATIPTKRPRQSNHTHPESASVRDLAASFFDNLGALTGLRPFFFQRSAADERHGRVGSRVYYWAKDLTAQPSLERPGDRDLICLVDVDMHISDFPSLLAVWQRPVVLYTFQPSAVAEASGEFTFTFDSQNRVNYTVSGGAQYKHQVWNYGGDFLCVRKTHWSRLWYEYVGFNLDRRQMDKHHQLIMLTPRIRFSSFLDVSSCTECRPLERLRVAKTVSVGGKQETFLALDMQTNAGMLRSIGKAGATNEATIPAAQDDALAAQARTSSTALSVAQVRTMTGLDDQLAATTLVEYHRAMAGPPEDVVFPTEESTYKYQFNPQAYDPAQKPVVLPFMAPFILGCYAPLKGADNEAEAVRGRITSVKSDLLETTPFAQQCMREFGTLLIPVPNQLVPVDQDEVRLRQSRPNQKRALEQGEQVLEQSEKGVLGTFMKHESAQKLATPRIITEFPGTTKVNYSRFTYAFAAHLRQQRWYAFGKTPKEIALEVARLAAGAQVLQGTDFSRMDGRVSKVLREFELMIMLRAFREVHADEISKLMRNQYDRKARTTHGIKYELGYARGSGSPETADMNSLDNAFVAYLALRQSPNPKTGTHYTPEEAYAALGLYAGDDGVSRDVDAEAYVKAASSVGQVLEIETWKRGERGVNFLARYYGPDVWHGDANSCCDIRRQLVKFHTTPALPSTVTPEQKLREKATSYNLTDRNTPVIGDICRTVEKVLGLLDEKSRAKGEMRKAVYWHSMLGTGSDQYPNEYGDWMVDLLMEQMPNFDMDKLRAWMHACALDGSHVLRPSLCEHSDQVHKAAEVSCVVNGQHVAAAAPKTGVVAGGSSPVVQASTAEKSTSQVCYAFQKGECKYGDKCKYKHVSVPPSERVSKTPCRYYADGKCTHGEKCKYSHSGPIKAGAGGAGAPPTSSEEKKSH